MGSIYHHTRGDVGADAWRVPAHNGADIIRQPISYCPRSGNQNKPLALRLTLRLDL